MPQTEEEIARMSSDAVLSRPGPFLRMIFPGRSVSCAFPLSGRPVPSGSFRFFLEISRDFFIFLLIFLLVYIIINI